MLYEVERDAREQVVASVGWHAGAQRVCMGPHPPIQLRDQSRLQLSSKGLWLLYAIFLRVEMPLAPAPLLFWRGMPRVSGDRQACTRYRPFVVCRASPCGESEEKRDPGERWWPTNCFLKLPPDSSLLLVESLHPLTDMSI